MKASQPLHSAFRIHPAVGVARVGNSEEFVIAPETMAGAPIAPGQVLSGGLPIRAGSEADPVRSGDLRDAQGALKRQAARFRIFHYAPQASESWPRGDGTEVGIGTRIEGLTVTDIIWTVHLANKKANTFVLEETHLPGIDGYAEGQLPPIRNAALPLQQASHSTDKIAILNLPERVRKLTIDPGPRTIAGARASAVHFDKATAASYYDAASASVVALARYPMSFPGDAFARMDSPAGPIDTLGSLLTDERGRLLVVGGFGRASGWAQVAPTPLNDDVNNDQWFDDTSDGPVSATLVFDDGSHAVVHGAWVTTTDPAYAPQIPNIVSLWDDVYDCWVRKMALAPAIFNAKTGTYRSDYKPSFDDQLAPMFTSAALQQWTVNMSERGMSAHRNLATIRAVDDPASTALAGLAAIFRNPFEPGHTDTTRMPLHLGDAKSAMLTLRQTQYFFLQRWNQGRGNYVAGSGPALGAGEYLDKATMVNCLGGRFSPGIDLTFTMREAAIYLQPWASCGAGPFRIRAAALDYAAIAAGPGTGAPLLSVGYVPRHREAEGLEPGDLSKFMAVPWHTDYNSCATHLPSPNPPGNRTLFWSWPAQRPVAVYALADVRSEASGDINTQEPDRPPQVAVLGAQRWSVRGPGTDSGQPENWGRYQNRMDILDHWHRIGVVMQASAIDGSTLALDDGWYLEVESKLVDTGLTPVVPFPNFASATASTDARTLDARNLFHQLMNVAAHPEVLPDARAYVDAWLAWAELFAADPQRASADLLAFDYSEDAFRERLDLIYQEMVDDAAAVDPGDNGQYFNTYAAMVTYTIQWAPFNLIDGAWLRNIGRTGPIDAVRALLYSVSMDEMGDGNVSMNHCNIYRDLCASVGYYPQPIDSREFAFDPTFLDSAFSVPAFQMAISQFSEDYYPELIGMTLYLEWQVVDLKPTRDLMEYVGIDPHFYVMHIGIDNAVNGHGQRAAEAVRLYLQGVRDLGEGEQAVQRAWRRIWNGFVAFGSIGSFGADLIKLVTQAPTLRQQMLSMIERKTTFGSRNHQKKMVGGCRIDEWFADPPGFLDALVEHGWITPGDWAGSRMHALMNFETGPMYRVFTDDEITLWADYTAALAHPAPPPAPPPLPPAFAMAALVEQLRPVQRGVAGHATGMMADPHGVIHSMAWWFEQSTRDLMAALASPVNGLVVPGRPQDSRFFMSLIAPTGPMGSAFSLPAAAPNSGTCRDVVHRWILNQCPLLDPAPLRVRLHSPRARHERNPGGKIIGMGGVH
ncbi:hypothetical protein F2P44_18250 [Massilia sp. CCM 8695]|uniref:Tyrosinase copper-binding domain-containing protein n=1 Tax=Massilia frigida TaxID=2609281 RepID=A0ABX0NF38_9BURK|nr:LodA/GoxA family CTQ-dependent oxidase [Massilia frigida]NHZ81201.1 hypothetical protein [Massilia frigida]